MINIEISNKDICYPIIYKYHYSKVMPRLNKYYLLVTENGNKIGVITLGWGTQPLGTIRKIFPNDNLLTNNYLEIGKMCFIPKYNNGNFGSNIMSCLIKFIRNNKEFKNVNFIYTLADGIMGKAGYIYQASNFKYIGCFDTFVYYNTITKEKIHPRTAKELLRENELFEGKNKLFRLTYRFMDYKGIQKIQGKMFRYVYAINKKGRAILKKYTHDYRNPKKEDIKRYLMQNRKKIEIDCPDFNMNIESGYNKKNINSFKFK